MHCYSHCVARSHTHTLTLNLRCLWLAVVLQVTTADGVVSERADETVTVTNCPPELGELTVPESVVSCRSTLTLSASAVDADPEATLEYTYFVRASATDDITLSAQGALGAEQSFVIQHPSPLFPPRLPSPLGNQANTYTVGVVISDGIDSVSSVRGGCVNARGV